MSLTEKIFLLFLCPLKSFFSPLILSSSSFLFLLTLSEVFLSPSLFFLSLPLSLPLVFRSLLLTLGLKVRSLFSLLTFLEVNPKTPPSELGSLVALVVLFVLSLVFRSVLFLLSYLSFFSWSKLRVIGLCSVLFVLSLVFRSVVFLFLLLV